MRSEQFMSIVEHIAAVFPGGCTVHMDPPGYTLQEHVWRRERRVPYGEAAGSAGTGSRGSR
jgi:hypothetical protein